MARARILPIHDPRIPPGGDCDPAVAETATREAADANARGSRRLEQLAQELFNFATGLPLARPYVAWHLVRPEVKDYFLAEARRLGLLAASEVLDRVATWDIYQSKNHVVQHFVLDVKAQFKGDLPWSK